ncbi:hypothetical protein J6590_018147 [Homalodisca vitripennis]|nr:hypothetical protein J6590_018147 [Homalodisca vitripennis]
MSVFSSKPAANGQSKDVPYARLLDASPTTLLPPKLDSDSRLHATRSILSVPEAESAPKSSVSDSKLAVDYFNTTAQQYNALVNSVNCPSQPSSAVISSESDHSLGRDEALVERTVSICSENQSEAFFSAEEELSGGQAGVVLPSSRSSSLRHSLGIYRHENGNNTIPKKRFGSDMSIVAGTGAVAQSAVLDLQTSRLSSHRSDHEIHTPEHRSNVRLEQGEDQKSVASQGVSPLMRHVPTTIPRSVSPRFMANGSNNILGLPDSLEAQEASTMLLDSSDTHSVSSTSFISAVSSQEDLALVNLHMQVNKPIVESPLLMSSYVNHLSQVSTRVKVLRLSSD